MNKKAITEDMHLEKEWFEEARRQTTETLVDFINHVMNDYTHDYGTICHAISACALAAAYAADRSENGGITGFQAGSVMWGFVREWCFSDNKCGLRIVDYDDMLYPQYGHKYEKTISEEVWNKLQKEAKNNLAITNYTVSEVRKHWQSIVDGVVPFGYIVKQD